MKRCHTEFGHLHFELKVCNSFWLVSSLPGLEEQIRGGASVFEQASEVGGERVVCRRVAVLEDLHLADDSQVARLGVQVLLPDGHVPEPHGPELGRVVEGDALLVVAGAHLEVARHAVEDAEAEPDADLDGGVDGAGEHVEAEHERVGQALAVFASPKSGKRQEGDVGFCSFQVAILGKWSLYTLETSEDSEVHSEDQMKEFDLEL